LARRGVEHRVRRAGVDRGPGSIATSQLRINVPAMGDLHARNYFFKAQIEIFAITANLITCFSSRQSDPVQAHDHNHPQNTRTRPRKARGFSKHPPIVRNGHSHCRQHSNSASPIGWRFCALLIGCAVRRSLLYRASVLGPDFLICPDILYIFLSRESLRTRGWMRILKIKLVEIIQCTKCTTERHAECAQRLSSSPARIFQISKLPFDANCTLFFGKWKRLLPLPFYPSLSESDL
jgi:hypothetical protein